MKKIICILSIFAALTVCDNMASAEITSFHKETVYHMDRGEPIIEAQEKAFKDAIRLISEDAGKIIESLSQVKDGQMATDRLEVFTAAVLHVKAKHFDKTIESNGELSITASVDAELDTDDAAELLNEIREARNSDKNYEAVLKAYTERKNFFDTVYGEYLDSYKKRILKIIQAGWRSRRKLWTKF